MVYTNRKSYFILCCLAIEPSRLPQGIPRRYARTFIERPERSWTRLVNEGFAACGGTFAAHEYVILPPISPALSKFINICIM